MTLRPCKHLDYDESSYDTCTLQTAAPHYPNVRFWQRNEVPYAGAPRTVQFCKLRGRINEVFACYQAPGPMSCYEPEHAS